MIQELHKMGGSIFKKFQNLNKKIPLMKVGFFDYPSKFCSVDFEPFI